MKQHNLSLEGGQLSKRLRQAVAKFGSHRILEWILHEGGDGTLQRLRFAQGLATNQILGSVFYDGGEPAGKSIRFPASFKTIEGNQKSLLRDIFRIFGVTGDSKRKEVRRPLISPNQDGEGLSISSLCGKHEGGV
jgi:hypothetical protein